ncbi:MAG: glycoside hydrolase family 19 protein [Bryobacteraceae bacterium]
MYISQSVGKNGVNRESDVKTVQALLNFNLHRLAALNHLKTDGSIGPATIEAIAQFQKTVHGLESPSARVDPDSGTLEALRNAIPPQFSEAVLTALMPDASGTAIGRYFHPLIDGMDANGIDTPLRKAHFLAQLGHESCDLRYSQELASGAAYEGRTDLGNTHPGDGPRFKGRGLIQITGRFNYAAYGRHKTRDFVTPPAHDLLATDPELAVDVSCWFWTRHNLNALSDSDDIRAVTKTINGGYNGLADRQARLDRAKCFLPQMT